MARQLKLLALLAVLALAALLASSWMLWNARMPPPGGGAFPVSAINALPSPRPLAGFTLRDDADRQFDLADLRGRWSFLFFGFTFCPDVCPTTLVDLARVHKAIVDSGVEPGEIQFVFVSVDPRRDTVAKLGPYVRHFDGSFRGATGSETQLANLARQLGAVYRVEYAEGSVDYPVQHTASVFLIDPLAQFHGVASPPLDPAAIARRFTELRRDFSTRTAGAGPG